MNLYLKHIKIAYFILIGSNSNVKVGVCKGVYFEEGRRKREVDLLSSGLLPLVYVFNQKQ